MQITCSNCGARQYFKYTAANVNSLIALGWNSDKTDLLCPKCAESTGGEGWANTARLIDDWAERQA